MPGQEFRQNHETASYMSKTNHPYVKSDGESKKCGPKKAENEWNEQE